MSGAVRNYSGTRTLAGTGPRSRKRRGRFRYVLLILIVLLLVYATWTTRERHNMNRLVPHVAAYTVVVHEPLDRRAKVGASALWDLVPADSRFAAISEACRRDLSAPGWVLRNLIGEHCIVTGEDFERLGDVVVVTKMSRFGTLLERLHVFLPDIESDKAGGLHLRRLQDLGLYYAVRGRVLALSPSREALIHSLTLTRDQALNSQALATLIEESGGEDLRGIITPGTNDRLGEIFETVRFALRIDADQAGLKCRGTLRPVWRERMAPLLDGLRPRKLKQPPPGLVEIALDFDRPLREVWTSFSESTGASVFAPEQSVVRNSPPDDGPPALTELLATLAGPMGPGLTLSWQGVDLDEIVPAPQLVMVVDVGKVSVEEVFNSLPTPPEDARPWDAYPRYDPEAKRVYVPAMGGPSIEPTAAAYGSSLLVSTSRTRADALLSEPASQATLATPGNVYVRVKPRPCLQAVLDAGMLFAELDMLRGHTRESFAASSAQWLEQAARVAEVRVLAGHDSGDITVEVTVVLSAVSAEAP